MAAKAGSNNLTDDNLAEQTFYNGVFSRFLSFARTPDPCSKLGTFDRLDSCYEQSSFDCQHILRFMVLLESNYNGCLEQLFNGSGNIVKRNTAVCYFDCTNYYFEIEQEDDEYMDMVTGDVLKGIRCYVPSKQRQPCPLVQMELQSKEL